jgi:hypothetical protein
VADSKDGREGRAHAPERRALEALLPGAPLRR